MSERRDEDNEIWAAIDDLTEQMEVVMGATDSISQALATLASDTSAALADIKAQVQTLQSEAGDPGKVQAIVDQIDSLDSQVKAADPGASPTPTPPAAAAPAAVESSPPPALSPDTPSSPSPDPSGAPASTPADPSASSPPEPTPGNPEPAKSVYTFTGDPSLIDASAWPASGFETDEATPRKLYYFSGDSAIGQTGGNGLSGGAWQIYTGPTKPVASAA